VLLNLVEYFECCLVLVSVGVFCSFVYCCSVWLSVVECHGYFRFEIKNQIFCLLIFVLLFEINLRL